jgi:hypothetical protein
MENCSIDTHSDQSPIVLSYRHASDLKTIERGLTCHACCIFSCHPYLARSQGEPLQVRSISCQNRSSPEKACPHSCLLSPDRCSLTFHQPFLESLYLRQEYKEDIHHNPANSTTTQIFLRSGGILQFYRKSRHQDFQSISIDHLLDQALKPSRLYKSDLSVEEPA